MPNCSVLSYVGCTKGLLLLGYTPTANQTRLMSFVMVHVAKILARLHAVLEALRIGKASRRKLNHGYFKGLKFPKCKETLGEGLPKRPQLGTAPTH